MRWGMTCLGTFSIAIAVMNPCNARVVWATPAVGFTTTTVVKGKFTNIDVINYYLLPNSEQQEHAKNLWLSMQKTRGPSDLYVQQNDWQPGGSTGWHSHPGHSLIIVTAGTVTDYEGHDPDCKPHVYTQGMGFVDPGGDHVHLIRNEGDRVAQTTAIQLIPAGAVLRIDAADPGNCHF